LFLVGRVRRPHGLSGEVSVELVAGFPGEITPGCGLLWQKGGALRPLTVSAVRPHAGRLLLCFEGIDGIQSATALSGGDLCVAEAPAAPRDFYYSHEIAGWRCEDPGGTALGEATGVEETPAGALLLLRTPAGKEVLVPFVRPIVARIDRDSRRIVLDMPEGLMDL
jgi:16S rRNA processing protein RimM